MIMNVLTLWQPWAWLIVNDELPREMLKDIENRTWETKYRGPLLIHAGKKFDFGAMEWLLANNMPDIHNAVMRHFNVTPYRVDRRGSYFSAKMTTAAGEFGGIVGVVDLYDIAPSKSRWAMDDSQHWQLRHNMTLPFTPFVGAQGLWQINTEVPGQFGSEFRQRLEDWIWAYTTGLANQAGITVPEIVAAIEMMIQPKVAARKEIRESVIHTLREYARQPIIYKRATKALGITMSQFNNGLK